MTETTTETTEATVDPEAPLDFGDVQLLNDRYPRSMFNLGSRTELLRKKHLPDDRTTHDWEWAETSARLCDGCNNLEDCRQDPSKRDDLKGKVGSGTVGFVRVISCETYLSTALRKCHYKKVADESKEKPWIEKRHSEKTLGGYVVTEKNRPAFTACHQYLRVLDERLASGRGLVLSGPTGVGKTHLAAAMFREVMIKRSVSGAFIYLPDWIQELKDRFGDRRDEKVRTYVEATMGSKFVVLDNFEFRQITDWLIDTLNQIVDYRYRLMLPTIVTTGWDPGQMAENLEPKLPSRLAEMGQWFQIDEKDWRRKTARSGEGHKPKKRGGRS